MEIETHTSTTTTTTNMQTGYVTVQERSAGGILGRVGLPKNIANLIRATVAEFVGVFFFVYIGGMSSTTGGVAAPFAHGFTIFILIVGVGPISGGHFNPAVTLGVLLSGGCSIIQAILYWIGQLIASFLAGWFIAASLRKEIYFGINGGSVLGSLEAAKKGQLVVVEAILTALLVYTVLCAAVDKKNGSVLAPLAIGCAVFVDIWAGGAVSGASMNPARSFGPLLSYTAMYDTNDEDKICGKDAKTRIGCADPTDVWKNFFWQQLIGSLIGAVIAAAIYSLR